MGVGDGVSVGVGDGVSVGVGDGVAVGVGDGVAVGVAVGCVVGVAVGCAVGVGAGVLVGATVAVGGFDGVGVVGEIGPCPFLPTSNATLPPTSVTATSPAIDIANVRREIFRRRAGTCAGMAWADKGAAAIVGKGAAKASFSVLPELNGLGVR